MKLKSEMIAAGLAMTIVGLLLSSVASADCGNMGRPKIRPSIGQDPSGQNESVGADAIVGFWKVKFLSESNSGIPDGTVLDAALAQWHSDGTEIMNSSRAPETQSFCLGVWTKTRPLHYRLSHFAISWANGALLGPANIREDVALSQDHNSFTGTFTIDQYDHSGNLLVHLTGNIEAKRITVDTPLTDLL